ncbi:alpha/beta fold hydrolase [Leptothoe spongobia]|uniref:Alpha/beta fold hydrolase n=1 Tax=Leptothoe spongobia TAU-MAC 1115 TaxID=1967444 RepID=A0A947GHH9_9CYAN|nr:alpha/beta fold hydrolase [Leptothoe spongobia]MBT9314067.1 alpha/beta fold hydrolase [Leptothoe spongobia TAU-MAC 1115]
MESIATPVETQYWYWQGFLIRYQRAGGIGPCVLLIHGFGASSDHWHKNILVLAQDYQVYAIDLLGYGFSAKPKPGDPLDYTFETWGQQIVDFCKELIGNPVFLIGNSIGCVVALQAAVMQPDTVRGIALLDCALRLQHERKLATAPWYQRFLFPVLQKVITAKPIGNVFFSQFAQPKALKKVLLQAYGRPGAVTDELVEMFLKPAREQGAVDVFLSFLRYSQGPLAEDLLPQINCPVLILWGTADPWENIELGKELAKFPAVEEFIPLEGIGHCPQDDAPDLVNPLLRSWLAKHSLPKD